jgi:2-dehydro-3-deoxyphosphogluconate aldolase/(4S)-4-hydroxy-2-oxoglutarate aldolase
MTVTSALAAIRKHKLVPVIVIEDAAHAAGLGTTLVRAGLPLAEVTFRTAAAGEAIRRMTAECPDLLVGAGTVLTPKRVAEARDAGAAFIVAPGFNEKVVDYCLEQDIPVFPGVATPSEIESALERGLSVLKFFPAEPLGGVPYLKAMSAPYGQLEFMPTGGITVTNLAEYLTFKKVVACGGSWIAPTDWIAAERWKEIESEIAKAVSVVRNSNGAVTQ